MPVRYNQITFMIFRFIIQTIDIVIFVYLTCYERLLYRTLPKRGARAEVKGKHFIYNVGMYLHSQGSLTSVSWSGIFSFR